MSRTSFKALPASAVVASLVLGPASAAAADPPSTRTTPIVVRVDDDGFGWSDAGIGALAGAGGALVLIGGAALLRSSSADGVRARKGE
jgi:hypothetical protein